MRTMTGSAYRPELGSYGTDGQQRLDGCPPPMWLRSAPATDDRRRNDPAGVIRAALCPQIAQVDQQGWAFGQPVGPRALAKALPHGIADDAAHERLGRRSRTVLAGNGDRIAAATCVRPPWLPWHRRFEDDRRGDDIRATIGEGKHEVAAVAVPDQHAGPFGHDRLQVIEVTGERDGRTGFERPAVPPPVVRKRLAMTKAGSDLREAGAAIHCSVDEDHTPRRTARIRRGAGIDEQLGRHGRRLHR